MFSSSRNEQLPSISIQLPVSVQCRTGIGWPFNHVNFSPITGLMAGKISSLGYLHEWGLISLRCKTHLQVHQFNFSAPSRLSKGALKQIRHQSV
jgi:hypothetical protein